MKEKGFTLIELLAVIVILAIIVLIATSIVLNIIEDSKKNAFIQTVNGIIRAAENYYMKEMMGGTKLNEDVLIKFPDSDKLEFDGEIPKTGSVMINMDGKVSLAISNGKYCATKKTEEDDVILTEDSDDCKIIYTNGIMSSENQCIINGHACSNIVDGIIVTVKINEEQTEDFYVLADDGNKLALLLNRNIIKYVAWYAPEFNSNYGPITALTALQNEVNTWSNITEINVNTFELEKGVPKEMEKNL